MSAINLYLCTRKIITNRITSVFFWPVAEKLVRCFEDIVWGISGKKVIECFGDSHASLFGTLNIRLPRNSSFRFRIIPVPGATASGILNPNSITNSHRIYAKWLNRIDQKSPVLFILGEVDCGFVIWLRAEKKNKDPHQMMIEAVKRYTAFLKDILDRHPVLLVCSSPLPTIKDGDNTGIIANQRSAVQAPQIERTQMTLEFNKMLREWCEKNNAIFIDLDALSVDPVTKLVKEELLHSDPYDHHYDTDAFLEIIIQAFENQNIYKEIEDRLAG